MPYDVNALIFDMDGVIADTSEYHFLSWKRLAEEEGLEFTREDNEPMRGVERRKGLSLLLKGQEIDDAVALDWMQRKNAYFHELLATMTPDDRAPGLTALLDEARSTGLKLGIASASRNVYPVLERLGLEDAFDAIADGYCVARTKPAPDLFLWAAGRLAVYPMEAIVLEDSEAGVEGALTGGFHVVGLGSGRVERAHLVAADLTEVPLSRLRAHFSA